MSRDSQSNEKDLFHRVYSPLLKRKERNSATTEKNITTAKYEREGSIEIGGYLNAVVACSGDRAPSLYIHGQKRTVDEETIRIARGAHH